MYCLRIISLLFFSFIAVIHAKVLIQEDGTRNAALDCTKFQRDLDVIRSFPYTVHINPLTTANRSFAIMNSVSQIEQLTILNEINVPTAVFCLVHLQTLNVIRTPFAVQFELDDDLIINSVPSLIGRLIRLRTLSLIRTPASYFSRDALALLTNLQSLEVDSCGLSELPSTINSTSLQVLKLPNNRLISLPDTIGTLGKTLLTIDLTNNSITALPASMGSLWNLTTVILSYNPLKSLAPLSGLTKLVTLYATNCQIGTLPSHLPSNLPTVTYLYLSYNNIVDISYLHNLASTRLYTLDLSYNQIDWMPPEIRRFTTLYNFYLNNNTLFYLPTEIFLMTSLGIVNIANNLFPPDELLVIRNSFRTKLPNVALTS